MFLTIFYRRPTGFRDEKRRHFRAMCLYLCAALFLCLPAWANIRALRIRPGGYAITAPASDLPVNGDMTLRVLIKRNPWDLVAHDILSIKDTEGNRRLTLYTNTSPWVGAFFANAPWNTPGIFSLDWGVPYGCPNGSEYEDWWMVIKNPTSTTPGYFRLYRAGAEANLISGQAETDYAIPVGTSAAWKGKPLSLCIGDPNTQTMADYQVLDVCWWSAALTGTQIAAIGNRQIASITNNSVRHLTDIYWYVRPSNTYTDHLTCELGACTGKTARDATLTGDITYTVDTPTASGWERPDDLTPPDPGTTPLAVTPGETTMTEYMTNGNTETTSRTLVVSTGLPWQYSRLDEQPMGVDGKTEATVEGLKPGTTYYVTGLWSDASGNVATRQLSATTTGVDTPTMGPTHALHITRGGEAVTATDPDGVDPLFFRMPYESDTTIRFFVHCAPTMTGLCWFVSQRSDAGVYSRFGIGLDQNGYLTAIVSDGEQRFEANSHEHVSSTGYDEVWMVYRTPTSTADGIIQLYKGTVLKASTPIPAGTDFTWKKWDAQFVLGGYLLGIPNPTIDYEMLEPAWWTKALSSEEMAAISGKPLFALTDTERQAGYLYWYARPHLTDGAVEPDLGASIGTAPVRHKGTITLDPGTIVPVIANVAFGGIQYTEDVSPALGGSEYTMRDVSAALEAASGLGDADAAFARLDAVSDGASANVIDIADAVSIARSITGLAS